MTYGLAVAPHTAQQPLHIRVHIASSIAALSGSNDGGEATLINTHYIHYFYYKCGHRSINIINPLLNHHHHQQLPSHTTPPSRVSRVALRCVRIHFWTHVICDVVCPSDSNDGEMFVLCKEKRVHLPRAAVAVRCRCATASFIHTYICMYVFSTTPRVINNNETTSSADRNIHQKNGPVCFSGHKIIRRLWTIQDNQQNLFSIDISKTTFD